MIYLAGPEDTAEFDAALALRRAIEVAWPSAATDPRHRIDIIAGARCHGQAVRDVDLLILARLAPGLRYDSFLGFTDASGQRRNPTGIEVRSLCIAIEVKDQPPERVRFIGTRVEVKYEGGWYDATEQSFRQVHSVRRYLKAKGMPEVFVSGLVWLRNVPATTLPQRPHPILGARLTWELVLNVLAQDRWPRRSGQVWVLDALLNPADDPVALSLAAELFTKVIEPTRLDRKRLERLHRRGADLAPITEHLGRALVLLRGRGGTGKTMRLLQLANYLADELGERVLILTYNRALVQDVRRLLTLMGIKDDLEGGTIHIRSVHSFVYGVLSGLELVTGSENNFLARYEELKEEALDFLRSGAVSPEDLAALALRDPLTFAARAVLVDEGQDWPDNERELVFRLFGAERVVVADGVEQMVRNTVPADWRARLGSAASVVVPLRRTLRMKSVLARFASAVAHALGLLQYEWEANEEIPGGRVVVLEGPYFGNRALHDDLVGRNAADGNHPVDMLVCLPPAEGGTAASLEAWGMKCWDGTREDERQGYPTDLEQIRVVRYESCRGLEGWTSINLGFDTFYEHRAALASTGDEDRDLLEAARWVMIPLTRAVDTLVVQLDGTSPRLRAAVAHAGRECGEAVEWVFHPTHELHR